MKHFARILSCLLVLAMVLALAPLCVSAGSTTTEIKKVNLYGLQLKYHNSNLAVRFIVLSNFNNFDRIGMNITVKDEDGEVIREKIAYSNVALTQIKKKSGVKTEYVTAASLGTTYMFTLGIDELPVTGKFTIEGQLYSVKNGNIENSDTVYVEIEDRAYVDGYKNGGADLSIFTDYAVTAMNNLCAKFWDLQGNHFYRTNGGNLDVGGVNVWESAQSTFALSTLYEATGDVTYKDMLEGQWQFRKTATGKNIMTGKTGLAGVPFLFQDDAAWGALELMAFYRALGDNEPLQWAHDLIVNVYNYWGTGSSEIFYGTKIKNCVDGLYYTYKCSYYDRAFQSLYAIPMCVAALEYCMAVSPDDPTAVDIYEPTYNIFWWAQDKMCRDQVYTYENYTSGRNVTVNYVDYLYYVDYGRSGENGPAGATNPSSTGSYCLFSNMAMAVCSMQLYKISGNTSYKDIAIRIADSITKYETYKDSGRYINERDHNVNCSMIGYFVKEVLTLPEMNKKNVNVLLNTASFLGTDGHVPNTNYYYVNWSSNYTKYDASYDNNKQNSYECQPVFANVVHCMTAAALYATLTSKK